MTTLMAALTIIAVVAVPYCYILALVSCKAYFDTKRQYLHEILNDIKE